MQGATYGSEWSRRSYFAQRLFSSIVGSKIDLVKVRNCLRLISGRGELVANSTDSTDSTTGVHHSAIGGNGWRSRPPEMGDCDGRKGEWITNF